MPCTTAPVVIVGRRFPVFPCRPLSIQPHQARVSDLRKGGCFFFGAPAELVGSFYLYVSMYCCLTCLGYIILGARQGRLFLWTRSV